METLLFQYLLLWKPLGYFLVFLGLALEGLRALFIASFLTYHGFLDFENFFLAAFSGAIIGDVFWYWLGKKINNSSSFVNKLTSRIKFADEHLINRLAHTIFVSKFIYGIHHLVILRAGALNLNLKKIIKYNILPTLLWILFIGGLGYLFGASFTLIKKYVKFIEIGLLIALIIFFVIEKFIKKRSEKKL
ncbi:MAG: VTT domain-containing protein [Patescibacteria group bacterium]|nr:VTT domain-containing protein [Patescibacteria group bacterium]